MPPDSEIYANRWKTLGVLCLSLMIIMVNNSTINVALPTMARDLHASISSLQWMVDTYALVFAGLLFTSGSLGDRFGRKGALQLGLTVFLCGTLLASTANTSAVVIVARAVMGVGAAFVMPSTLSILANVFPPHERGRAISIWAGIAASGAAIGPVTSGLLIEHFWWGSVFLVNVPLIVTALVAGRRFVPKSNDPARHPLDLVGAALSIAGVSTLVYAIIEGPVHGWASTPTFVAFGAAVAGLVVFGLRELKAKHPMLDLRLFGDRRFSVASAGIGLTFFAMFGTMFLLAQYLQLVLGYSPLHAGLVQLPFAFIIMSVAPQAPKLVARFGNGNVASAGLSCLSLGLLVLTFLRVESGVALVFAGIFPLAVGMALTPTPLTTLIMSAVPLGRAGVGSAMNDTTRELGGALGVAVLGSIVTSRYTSALGSAIAGLPASSGHLANSGLSGALQVAAGLPSADGQDLGYAARRAFVDGLNVATVFAAIVIFLAAIGARLLLPSRAAREPAVERALAGTGERGRS